MRSGSVALGTGVGGWEAMFMKLWCSYRAVAKIISKHGAPKIVPPSDWHYTWVRDTLSSLEAVILQAG